MSQAAEINVFRTALRAAIVRFDMEEPTLRTGYERQVARGEAAPGLEEDLLERISRRYLIDPLLRALDWDPDDPGQMAEEARSWAENGDRLYFDYLACQGPGPSRRSQRIRCAGASTAARGRHIGPRHGGHDQRGARGS